MTKFVLVLLAGSALGATIEMDSNRGQRVFESESCVQCHAIGGQGGHLAPDLGRVIDRDFTPASLASTMWNHAPAMWSKMTQQNIKRGGLNDQAAADLFAYFYSVHFFDKPGDAGRGKRLFHDRTCDTCHGLSNSPNASAPPVAKWDSIADPIELTQVMWNHSGAMYAELQTRKMGWPQLTGQDLSDLLVYFRNLPGIAKRQTTLITTSGAQGEELFASKGCKQCHDSSTLLFRTELSGRTLTDVAAALWDHGPRMKTPPAHFDVDQMRELLSYLWANQFFSVAGIPERGKKIFASKHCASCHDDASSGAPSLSKRGEPVNGSTMVSILWRHGPEMLAQMNQKKIKWPRFEAFEMADLISYLNTR
jgi:cytochrome c551/c552